MKSELKTLKETQKDAQDDDVRMFCMMKGMTCACLVDLQTIVLKFSPK